MNHEHKFSLQENPVTFQNEQPVLVEAKHKQLGKVIRKRHPEDDLYLVRIPEQTFYCDAKHLTAVTEPLPSPNADDSIALTNLAKVLKRYEGEPISEQLNRPEVLSALNDAGILDSI
jgi:hypothetical protein